jgi:hypothetical protein
MNHTPGPWTHNFGQDGWLIEAADEEQTYRVACVFEDIGAYRIPDADNRDDEGEANARFIVQACNSHDELLEALRPLAALGLWEDNYPPDSDEYAEARASDSWLEVWVRPSQVRAARAAIAKAGG